MLKYLSLAHISAGFVAVLIGYTSAGAIVYQAAVAAGGETAHISSWLWAVGIGMGVSSIGLSLYYRQPVLIAWSTPGAALLATSLPGIPMSDAIGAFVFSSLLLTVCGLTGWFDKIMRFVPQSLATAMLAGVLLRFCLGIFPAFTDNTILVGAMVACYILGKLVGSRYTIPMTFAVGIGFAVIMGEVHSLNFDWNLTTPVWVTPTFDPAVLIGVGLPLFIVTMASQNVPGIAVLRAHGYEVPASPLIGWSGFFGILLAPFGGYAFNLAAITAAICMGEDVDPKPERRYLAVLWAGGFYCLVGAFGAAVVSVFSAFPHAVIATIAGLALLGTVANSLYAAMLEAAEREAAILTFVVTAAGGAFMGVGSPFWGLLVGISVLYLSRMPKLFRQRV
jgi:benzoate membrane transport protein